MRYNRSLLIRSNLSVKVFLRNGERDSSHSSNVGPVVTRIVPKCVLYRECVPLEIRRLSRILSRSRLRIRNIEKLFKKLRFSLHEDNSGTESFIGIN